MPFHKSASMIASLVPLALASACWSQVQVYQVPAGTGSTVLMSDIDPTLPELNWMLEQWQGMGTFNSFDSLLLLEPGVGNFDFPAPTTYDYEIYSVTNDWFFDAYNLTQGTQLDASLSGWSHPMLLDGISSSSAPLVGHYNDESFHCTEVRAQSVPSGQVNYIGFRYRLIGATDWNYGWASFSVTEYENPNASCIDGGSGQVLSLADYAMHEIAVQTTPGASITVGDTGCQPDLNTDGSLNFLDISEFLNTQPDYNNDLAFNFLDVSAFLSEFAQGCP